MKVTGHTVVSSAVQPLQTIKFHESVFSALKYVQCHQEKWQQYRSRLFRMRNGTSGSNQKAAHSAKCRRWRSQGQTVGCQHAHACCDLAQSRSQRNCSIWSDRDKGRWWRIVPRITADLPSGATARSSKSILEITDAGAWTADVGKSNVTGAVGIGLRVTAFLSSSKCRQEIDANYHQRASATN
jgi:hypothetical protein